MRYSVVVSVCALLLCAVQVFGQAPASVRGVVVEKISSKPLAGASVLLLHLPDSTRQGSISNRQGAFVVDNVQRGRYLLTVSFVGYKPYSRPLTVADSVVNLGSIALVEDDALTKEIVVETQAPSAVQKGDTSEYSARAYKTAPDANVQDLVGKMPGVVVQDGKVQAQGEDVQQVLVDGKPFFGDDPSAALRNLPAEVVDKIQVFDQQSEQAQFTGFSDGNTRKTLNIITRSGMQQGQFGKLFGGYGNEERYKLGGNYNIFNKTQRVSLLVQSNNINEQNFSPEDLLGVMASSGSSGRRGGMGGGAAMMRGGPEGSRPSGGSNSGGGRSGGPDFGNVGNFLVEQRDGYTTTHAFGVNYVDSWGTSTELSASYFFNLSDNDASENAFRTYILPSDSGQVYTEDNTVDSRNINHRLNVRLEHKIDSSNSFVLRPRLSVQQNDGSSLTSGLTELSGAKLSSVLSDYSSDLLGLNFSSEFVYRYKFPTQGRTLSLSLTPGYTHSNGESSLTSESAYFTGAAGADSARQRSDLLKNGWSLAAEIDYTEPLSKTSMLEFEYEGSYAFNESDKKTYDELSDSDDLLPALSSTFTSRYMTHSLGTGYRYQTGPLQMSVEAAYQIATLKNDKEFPTSGTLERTFNSVLPSAMLRVAFSEETNLRLFYRTRTSAPSIDQLQSVLNNDNPLQLTSGNPELEEEYNHSLFMRFSSVDKKGASSFFAMLGGTVTNNYIGNNTTVALRDTTVDGVALAAGSQLTRPANMDGRVSLRSFAMYSLPVSLIQSNVNFNASATYTRTPGLVNNSTNYSSSPALGVGVAISSNISENFDFTVSSQSLYTVVDNSLQEELNTEYFSQNTRARVNCLVWDVLVLQTDLSHQHYSGLSEGYNQNYLLWNLGLGVKLFGERQGELKLTVYDVLNQSNSVKRNVTETYIEDVQTDILRRYAMLTFTYNLRSFGSGTPVKMDMPFPPPGH